MRRVGFFLVVAFLLLTGVIGIRESASDWSEADTLGRMVSSVFIAAFGCLGIGAGVAVLARRPWAGILILGWGAGMLGCTILASSVWHWPGIVPVVVTLLVMSIIVALTYGGWRATARPRSD